MWTLNGNTVLRNLELWYCRLRRRPVTWSGYYIQMYCIETVSILCFIDQSNLTDRIGETAQLCAVRHTSIVICTYCNVGSQQKTQFKKILWTLRAKHYFFMQPLDEIPRTKPFLQIKCDWIHWVPCASISQLRTPHQHSSILPGSSATTERLPSIHYTKHQLPSDIPSITSPSHTKMADSKERAGAE